MPPPEAREHRVERVSWKAVRIEREDQCGSLRRDGVLVALLFDRGEQLVSEDIGFVVHRHGPIPRQIAPQGLVAARANDLDMEGHSAVMPIGRRAIRVRRAVDWRRPGPAMRVQYANQSFAHIEGILLVRRAWTDEVGAHPTGAIKLRGRALFTWSALSPRYRFAQRHGFVNRSVELPWVLATGVAWIAIGRCATSDAFRNRCSAVEVTAGDATYTRDPSSRGVGVEQCARRFDILRERSP